MKSLNRKAGEIIFGIKKLCGMAQPCRAAWIIWFIWSRYVHRLNALYSGMLMNRQGYGNLWNFRRNIHRLEKGLLYKDLKLVFADSYIQETVEYFSKILSSPIIDQNTIIWGEAVLEQYFGTCQHTQKVAEAYGRYKALNPENPRPDFIPYYAKQRPELTVGYEALYQLALRRRSVRSYLDKPVDLGAVEYAMRVAALAPSACNRQSFKFLFFDDREVIGKISRIPGGFTGYDAPGIVVVIGSYRGYFDERDVDVPVIDVSMAAMSFMFALETLGLSSVCINWPSLPEKDGAIRYLIHLENDEVVIMLIALGYPDPEGKVTYSAKRETHCLISYNERLIDTGNA